MLPWLRSQAPPCPWDERACSAAARDGQLGMLQWLRSEDPPCPWDEWACTRAADGGRLGVLPWLRSEDPPCLWAHRCHPTSCRGTCGWRSGGPAHACCRTRSPGRPGITSLSGPSTSPSGPSASAAGPSGPSASAAGPSGPSASAAGSSGPISGSPSTKTSGATHPSQWCCCIPLPLGGCAAPGQPPGHAGRAVWGSSSASSRGGTSSSAWSSSFGGSSSSESSGSRSSVGSPLPRARGQRGADTSGPSSHRGSSRRRRCVQPASRPGALQGRHPALRLGGGGGRLPRVFATQKIYCVLAPRT